MISVLITCGIGIIFGIIYFKCLRCDYESKIFLVFMTIVAFLSAWLFSLVIWTGIVHINDLGKEIENTIQYPVYSHEDIMFFIDDNNEFKEINKNMKMTVVDGIDTFIVEKREYNNFFYPWGYEYFLMIPSNQVL